MNISVVVPSYNESESLPELCTWIDKVMTSNSFTYEIIIADDGSTDDSWEVIQKLSKSKNDNEIKEAEKLDKTLQPLHHAMFVESNPSPVKYAAKLLKLCEDDVRLPLVKVTESTKEIVKQALRSAKLI